MEREVAVVNLDEIATHWQIPVEVVKTFIVEYGLNPLNPGAWAGELEHWNLLIAAKQQAFEESLFPRPTRPEPAKTSP